MFSNHDLIDAVANRRFATLTHLEAVVDVEFDEPWFSTGKSGIVFKLIDPKNGQRYALKVFKERDAEKEERLRRIGEQIAAYPSHYWVSYEFLEDEILVESRYGDSENACAVLMEWVEGKTLGEYVKEYCEEQDHVVLYQLAYTFDQMALWLLANPFSHGDLKHDNIILKPNGLPVLVDYDGMYFPIFDGQPSMELGTPDYQHPERKEKHFGSFLDDFSMLVISLSLHSLAHEPKLYFQYNSGENLIFVFNDFLNSHENKLLDHLFSFNVTDIHQRLALFDYAITLSCQSLTGIEAILRCKPLHYSRLLELFTNPDNFENSYLVPYRKEKKWGLMSDNGKLIVRCNYDSIKLTAESVFVVEKNKKFGLIDKSGKEITECEYLNSEFYFSEGLAKVELDSQWGYINTKGNLVIEHDYAEAENFSDGLAVVSILGASGYGFIDRSGIVVLSPDYYFSAGSFCNGFAMVQDWKGNMCIVNRNFRSLFSYPIEDIFDLSPELAAIRFLDKWSVMNKSDGTMYPGDFYSIEPFSEGFAIVRNDDKKFGFINQKAELVIPYIYFSVNNFSEEYALVMPYIEDEIIYISKFITKTGKSINQCNYDEGFDFKDGMAAVRLEDEWGFINKLGELTIPFLFEDVHSFSEGWAAVKQNGKWGYIDIHNKAIIPLKYFAVKSFSQGLAMVREDEKWGYIDKKGIEYWED